MFFSNLDANEANKLAHESIKKQSKQQLKRILECIQLRAATGYFGIIIQEPLSSENKKALEQKGYKIWEKSYPRRSKDNEIFTTISWGTEKEKEQ